MHISPVQVSMITLEYFSVSFNTVIKVRSVIKKNRQVEIVFFLLKVKTQYQEWFCNNSGNGFMEKKRPRKPLYMYFGLRFYCVFIKSY